jgi:hypothetical protein
MLRKVPQKREWHIKSLFWGWIERRVYLSVNAQLIGAIFRASPSWPGPKHSWGIRLSHLLASLPLLPLCLFAFLPFCLLLTLPLFRSQKRGGKAVFYFLINYSKRVGWRRTPWNMRVGSITRATINRGDERFRRSTYRVDYWIITLASITRSVKV